MKKIYYEKVGCGYVPVAEYDSDWMDSFHKGTHLVTSYPGGRSTVFDIDPNYAALIAAGRVAQEPMREAIRKAAEMHLAQYEKFELDPEQKAAWDHFVEVMGERGRYVQYSSIHDIAEAGITALEEQAQKLMSNASVRSAYEQFLLVCKLTESNNQGK